MESGQSRDVSQIAAILRQRVAIFFQHEGTDPLDAFVGLRIFLSQDREQAVAHMLLILRGLYQPPGQELQMSDEPIMIRGLLIEFDGEVISHHAAKLLDQLGDLVDLGEIGLFHLGIDGVERDESRLILREADPQILLDDIQRLEAQLVLGGIVPLDVPQQCVRYRHPVQGPAHRCVDVVAQVDIDGVVQVPS